MEEVVAALSVVVVLPLSCVFLGIKSPTPQQLHLPIKHAFATVASGHGQEQSEKRSNHLEYKQNYLGG